MAYWLVKSEPSVYPYSRLAQEGRTRWDGVRNFEARNNLRAMEREDLCLYYHSVEEKAVVGIARVVRTAYPDPTIEVESDGGAGDQRGASGSAWVAVDLAPHSRFTHPVELSAIKATPGLSQMALLRRPRLSVTPVTEAEFAAITLLGGRSG